MSDEMFSSFFDLGLNGLVAATLVLLWQYRIVIIALFSERVKKQGEAKKEEEETLRRIIEDYRDREDNIEDKLFVLVSDNMRETSATLQRLGALIMAIEIQIREISKTQAVGVAETKYINEKLDCALREKSRGK